MAGFGLIEGKLRMATIRKRGEYSYEVQIRKRGFEPVTKTFTYRSDAEKFARRVESEQERGAYLDIAPAERVTMNELFDRYEENVLPSLRGKSAKPALRLLRLEFGKLSLAGIQSARIAAFRDKRAAQGKAASTIKKEISLLSKIITLASKEWGYPIAINPCSMISRPSELGSARERRLFPGEEKYLISAAKSKSKHHAALVRLIVALVTQLPFCPWMIPLSRSVDRTVPNSAIALLAAVKTRLRPCLDE